MQSRWPRADADASSTGTQVHAEMAQTDEDMIEEVVTIGTRAASFDHRFASACGRCDR